GVGGGQRVGDQVQDAPGGGSFALGGSAAAALFMIVGRNGPYLAKTTHDHGSGLAGARVAEAGVGAGEDGLLGEEGLAQAAGAAARGGVEGLEGVGEAALAPGQAGGKDRARPVVVRQRGDGGGRGPL